MHFAVSLASFLESLRYEYQPAPSEEDREERGEWGQTGPNTSRPLFPTIRAQYGARLSASWV
jgi:hypothetical protein